MSKVKWNIAEVKIVKQFAMERGKEENIYI